MKLNKSGIKCRILVPVFVFVLLISLGIFLLVHTISDRVQEDYFRFTATSAGGNSVMVLELAASELIAAKLIDNPVVIEAKKRAVLDSIVRGWEQSKQNGIISVTGGRVLFTTLPQRETAEIVGRSVEGYHVVQGARDHYHCFSRSFPLWGWTVTTVLFHGDSHIDRKDVLLLLPIVTLGFFLIIGGLFIILRRNLQQPVEKMVRAMEAGGDVPKTGVSEFDHIGDAVNMALNAVRLRSEALSHELAERVRAEAAVIEKEARIRLLLDSTAEGIYGVDMQGNCTFCNPSCLRQLGYDDERELLGKSTHALFHHTHPDGRPYQEQDCFIYKAYQRSDLVHVDSEVFWKKDKTSFPVEYWSYPVIENGRVAGAVVTFIDITERRRVEQKVQQSQKMEALGTLAGGVAHDFNNILTPILGYSGLVLTKLSPSDPLAGYLQQITKAAERAKGLVQQILTFSRQAPQEKKPIQPHLVLDEVLKLLRATLPSTIAIREEIPSDCGTILVDPTKFHQIIMNLCTNAYHAMRETGGVLGVSLAKVAIEEDSRVPSFNLAPGKYVVIEVSDTGCGMEKETLAHVFDPYFTTKAKGEGTGLGLSVVDGIVKSCQGNITVYSEPGKGSSFHVYLPRIADTPSSVEAGSSETVPTGTERVLVVDDEEMIAMMLQLVLQDIGYQVTFSCNSLEALARIEQDPHSLDLLITDMTMPNLTGFELAKKALNIRPDLPIIICTGFSELLNKEEALALGIRGYLMKPVSLSELGQAMRTALEK